MRLSWDFKHRKVCIKLSRELYAQEGLHKAIMRVICTGRFALSYHESYTHRKVRIKLS